MKRKTRMYEPWGYQEENNYQGAETIIENDLESFFADAKYNKDDNKIHFQNKDGEDVGSLDVNEFVKSDSIIDHTEYSNGILKIYFTNGDVITIDLTELLDENEFKDGLVINDHIVKVLIDGESDKYISVSENGIKVAGVEADIEAEKTRAEGEEQRIETKLDEEIARAIAEEERIDAKLDKEIADRIADVDEEETRATEEETTIKNTIGGGFFTASTETVTAKFNDLLNALTTEINNRTTQDNQLQNNINTESTARQAADTRLENLITDERNRATVEEQRIDAKLGQETSDRIADVDEEETRAKVAETELAEGIDILGSAKFDDVVYDSSAKTITFYAEGNAKGEIDTTDFVKDGMISDVKIEDGKLKIIFNTDSGKEEIDIPLTEIFNPANYYDKDAVDNIVNGFNASITDEASTRAENDESLSQSINSEIARAEAKETALQASIETEAATARAAEQANADAIAAEKDRAEAAEALKANSADVDAALALKADKSEIPTDFYTKGEVDGKDNALQSSIDANADAIEAEEARALSAETGLQDAIDLKADKETTYTKEEVDALIKAKEIEIYNLTKLVGEIGGNVVYNYPNDLGTSLTSLLNNSGTVKLGEDATISRFASGIFAKNKVKLNLNNHNLTATSAGEYGAIMSRGTQEITIYGKGTIDAGGGICIEANSENSVINLTGSTTIYENDRSGGELIYCYVGTINIINGTFRNNGDDKKFLLNCYDANRAAGTAKIVVYGGKFYDFNPADNTAEGEHTNFLAPGYHVETNTVTEEGVEHTVYTVKKDA